MDVFKTHGAFSWNELVTTDPAAAAAFYGELFGWEFATDDAATEAVSEPGNYGFVDQSIAGLNGGVGGGDGYERRVLFYVGVPDVGAALAEAERLGGTREMGPEGTPGRLVVARFTDPEGNVIGLAGPE